MAAGKVKSKKGPKGKKARAKAKFDRQWGEFPEKETKLRTGNHRLAVEPKKRESNHEDDMPPTKTHQDPVRSSENENEGNEVAVKDFWKQLQSQRRLDDDSSVDSSDSGTEAAPDDVDILELDFATSVDDPLFAQHFDREPLSDVPGVRPTRKLWHVGGCDAEMVVSDSFLSETTISQHSDPEEWRRLAKSCATRHPALEDSTLSLSSLAQVAWALLKHRLDLLLTCEQLSYSQIQSMVINHVLQHVVVSRSQKMAHNGLPPDAARRDQGFTRPMVLILLPTRGTCHDFVDELLTHVALQPADQQLKRFEAEYGPPPTPPTDNDVQRHRKKTLQGKGKEWNALFGDDVNDDDDFKLGLSFSMPTKNKGLSAKLYTDFYKSDIIVASPLGLKMLMDDKEATDFLSSIEICHVALAEVLLMQNWDHVDEVLASLNARPINTNDTDFSRVRQYFLQDQAQHWRQLIVSGRFVDPHLISSFKKYAKSRAGLARLRVPTRVERSSIANVILPIRQVFQRVPVSSIAQQSEERLKFFEDKVLPQISNQSHTLLFIPSYFDFVYVRNLFLRKELDFCSVTEYSRNTETNRGRARFLQGRKPIMLYTGRAHYFLRHHIKGARHIIFYGLPEHASFYHEHMNMLNEGLDEDAADRTASCLVLFAKYDAHALDRVVGSSHALRMIQGDKSTFLFTT